MARTINRRGKVENNIVVDSFNGLLLKTAKTLRKDISSVNQQLIDNANVRHLQLSYRRRHQSRQ